MKKVIYILLFFFAFSSFTLNVEAEEIHIDSFSQLNDNIASGESEFILDDDITFDASITIDSNIKIDGNNHIIYRDSSFVKNLFIISATGSLELNNLVIDGGASGWKIDIENRYYTDDTRSAYVRFPSILDDNDITASYVMINNSGNLTINNSSIKNIRCTSTGCLVYGKGNNTIKDSTFTHICSSKNGGVMYITGGETVISGSTFKDNASGCGVTTSTQGGAIYVTGASLLEVKDNSVFEENLAQNNSGAIYIVKTNTLIENTKFIHNKCGNDGSALTFSSTSAGHSILVQNIEFDGNHGYATRGQSLGTIWLQKWVNDEDHPVVFKDLVFKNNIVSTGGAISDSGGDATHVKMENIEVYNSSYKNGGAFFFQGIIANVSNVNVHDNKCIYDELDGGNTCRGAAIYMKSDSPAIVNNLVINDNEGSGICIQSGKIDISDSTIANNAATHLDGGGGIQIRGSETSNMIDVSIKNTIISNNTSNSYGGGISIFDDEDFFSKITVDDQSKIYDNKSDVSGDDFAYRRTNGTENVTDNSITLDNISIAGITGVDGWYHDNEDDRYADTDNPTVFNDYVDYKGSGLYLKVGGLSNLDYDLVEGENDDITPVVIRYGVPYVVTNEEPLKDGYEFVGWNTKEDGSGITLNSGDTYDGSDGYVLYAQYQIANPETSDTMIYYFINIFISLMLLMMIGLLKKKVMLRN